MKEIKAYIRNEMLDTVLNAIAALPNSPAVTVVKEDVAYYRSGAAPTLTE